LCESFRQISKAGTELRCNFQLSTGCSGEGGAGKSLKPQKCLCQMQGGEQIEQEFLLPVPCGRMSSTAALHLK